MLGSVTDGACGPQWRECPHQCPGNVGLVFFPFTDRFAHFICYHHT